MRLSFIDKELNSKKALLLTSVARNYTRIEVCARVLISLSLVWENSKFETETSKLGGHAPSVLIENDVLGSMDYVLTCSF